MSFRDELFQRRDEIIAIAKKYDGSNLRVFGSVARGDDRADSDLDLLVELAPECDLFDYISIIQDAVLRNLEIIGEASRKIDENYKLNHQHIPWNKLIGLRKIICHNYRDIDNHEVWNNIKKIRLS